jgi:hypothetical protein
MLQAAYLTASLERLEAEHQKGVAEVQRLQQQLLRLEGALLLCREFLALATQQEKVETNGVLTPTDARAD